MKIIAFSGKARNGKTTVANMFKLFLDKDNKRSIIVNYAGYVKYIASTYYCWDGKKNVDGRTLLQSIGDNARVEICENFWIDKLMDDIKLFCMDYDYVIIDDCRYPNEITIPKSQFDLISIRVNRLNFISDLTEEQKNHRSELALDDYNFDYTVNSKSGAIELLKCAESVYNNMKSGE